ncbi:diaminopimelate epimerase [Candidatus Vidania fulgoroideorum]
MYLRFLKMHAYGNDFVITKDRYIIVSQFADRNCCVGYDQQICFRYLNKNIFACYILNTDGTVAYNCFNGLRCVSKYIFKVTGLSKVYLLTHLGCYKFVISDGYPGKIVSFLRNPTTVFDNTFVFAYRYMFFRTIALNTQVNFFLTAYYFTYIFIGNPHAVFFTFMKKSKLLTICNKFVAHTVFLDGINVSFFDLASKTILTYERGVGFTRSCGTGILACCIAYFLCSYVSKLVVFCGGAALTVNCYSCASFSLVASGAFSYLGLIKFNDYRFKK